MKIRIHGVNKITIVNEHIRLDSLLKYAAIASTGGEAKIMIQNGDVFVNGERCALRGKKIMPGDVVRCDGSILLVEQSI